MSETVGHDECDLMAMGTNPEMGQIDRVIEALSGYVAGDVDLEQNQVVASLELARRAMLRLSTLRTAATDKLIPTKAELPKLRAV